MICLPPALACLYNDVVVKSGARGDETGYASLESRREIRGLRGAQKVSNSQAAERGKFTQSREESGDCN